MRPKYELADVVNLYGHNFLDGKKVGYHKTKVLRAIVNCRTAVLGGHILACSQCGHQQIAYNSCRNRHCPKCQIQQREKWIQARTEQILPVKYFHIVFTLPCELNSLCLHYPKQLYNTLFRASWKTLEIFFNDSKYLGAKSGMTSILHTWGQNLSLHPHIHCLVPCGGIDTKNKWKTGRGKGKYLFPVKAMSIVFKSVFLKNLKQLHKKGDICHPTLQKLVNTLFKKSWIVYAKRPFGGAQSVIEYLGRYSHKVAISNHRIKAIKNGNVIFTYKNYRNNQTAPMCLNADEFIRRFTLHILPKGFVRIRHFGICAPTNKKLLACVRSNLLVYCCPAETTVSYTHWELKLKKCPICKMGLFENIETIPPIRGSPFKK